MLRDAATPAPWDGIVSSDVVRYLGPPTVDNDHGDYVCQVYNDKRKEQNKLFIAAARSATLPEMVVELVREIRSLKEQVRKAYARMDHPNMLSEDL